MWSVRWSDVEPGFPVQKKVEIIMHRLKLRQLHVSDMPGDEVNTSEYKTPSNVYFFEFHYHSEVFFGSAFRQALRLLSVPAYCNCVLKGIIIW